MRYLIAILLIVVSQLIAAQTTVFHENFEGPSYSDSVQTSGTQQWALSSQFSTSGVYADSARIINSQDSSLLTTLSFSTLGKYQVYLEFNNICKIEFDDGGYVQVSGDNGATWTTLQANHYMGNGQFSTNGSKFSSITYTDWMPQNNLAIPTNSWWKSEKFNVSTLLANKANAKIRFILKDLNGTGGNSNFGWFIDDIKVNAAIGELIPPTIIMLSQPQGNIYGTGSYKIEALITDSSGIDSVQLVYTVNNNANYTLLMQNIAGDTFRAYIPFYGFGTTICYKIKAVDGSYFANEGYFPNSFSCQSITSTYSTGGIYTIGTGTGTNTSSASPSPYAHYWTGNRSQYLIRASELLAAGATAGNIESLAFNVLTPDPPSTSGSAPSGARCKNYTIKLKNTSTNTLTSVYEFGLTTVYSHPNYGSTAGWNTHNFTNTFNWDGISNLLVEICFDNYVTGSDYSDNAIAYLSTTSYTSAIYFESDNGSVCNQSSGSTLSSRPNMKFNFLNPVLPRDIGIEEINNPGGSTIANTNQEIKIKIKNFGSDTITSAQIQWKYDGIIQTPYNWTGIILQDSVSQSIIIDTINFTQGTHSLEFWTNNPNGNFDFNTLNDKKTIQIYACNGTLSGNYTIGGISSDYPTITEAAMALTNCGVNGAVTFNIQPGVYNENVEIKTISGSSIVNKITFKSATNDSTSVIIQNQGNDSTDNYIIKLKGVNDIIFKYLTFKSLDTIYGKIIELIDSNQRVEFSNNQLISTAVNPTNNHQNLINGQQSIIDGITIKYNLLENGFNGINIDQINTSQYQNNITTVGNIFLNQRNQAILLDKIDNLDFSKNEIANTIVFSNFKGIKFNRTKGNWVISNNKIKILSGQTAINISNTENTIINKSLIFNNMIIGQGNINQIINLEDCSNMIFGFNTINLESNIVSDILKISKSTGNSLNIDIYNNIFSRNNNNGFYINFGFNPVGSNFNVNNNNYYSNQQSQIKFGNESGNIKFWKEETGFDTQSIEEDPLFSSNNDLHISNNTLASSGIPISQISLDIDNQPRKTNSPSIGCDEITNLDYDLGIIEITNFTNLCGKDTNETLQLIIKNYGTQSINNGTTASYKIKGSTNIVTENISQNINSGDTLVYNFIQKANISVANTHRDSIFEIDFFVNHSSDSAKYNDSINVNYISLYQPEPPVTSTTTTNYGNSLILTAASNDSLFWYLSQNATQDTLSGKFFTTPILHDTTTYWVSAKGTIGGQYAIGNGTTTNATTGYPAPYSNYKGGAKHQMLIRSSELKAAGVKKGYIKTISFDVASIGIDMDGNLQNFKIDLTTTTETALTNSQFLGGLTNVLPSTLANIHSGINTHLLQTPFYWDGNANLLVQIVFNNSNIGTTSKTVQLKNSNTAFSSCNWYVGNSLSTNQIENATIPSGLSTTRPNIILDIFGDDCESSKSQLQVNIINFPINDCGISHIINPIDTITAGQIEQLNVKLQNFGLANLTSAQIFWSLNGVIKDTIFWTGLIGPGTSTIVNLGNISFSGGQNCISVWTSQPNNLADSFPTNDSAIICIYSCFNGVYTIGNIIGNNYDYTSFGSAISDLIVGPICGNVIFLVDSGNYNERLILPNLPNSGPNQQVTFRSMHSDSTYAKISYSTSSTARNVINILGSYYNIENISISSSSGATYARGIEIAPNVHNINIKNCHFIGKTTTSSGDAYSLIYAQGTGIHNINILYNYISKGSYPINLYGSGTNPSKNNKIIGNQIIDFYYYGPQIYYTDSLIFESNLVRNIQSNSYVYGIYMNANSSFKILKNKFEITGYSQTYGLRIQNSTSPANSPALIANNFLSVTGTGTSSWFGFHLQTIVNLDFIHNSTRMIGGGANANTFLVSGGSGIRVMNNNFAVTSGNGFPIYITSPTAIIYSDYNNYSSVGPNIAYWSGAKTSVASLTSTSLKDSNSVSISPAYTSNRDLHLLSNSLSAKGILSNKVTDDIDNKPRTTTPTIGAHEVPIIPYDGGITEIIFPATTTEGINYPLFAVIKNFGLNTLDSFPIKYKVNNSNTATFFYYQSLSTGQSDTIQLTNLISPAGNSTICAFTQIANDTNFFNDSICINFFGNPGFDLSLRKIIPIQVQCGMQYDTLKLLVENTGNQNITSNFLIKYQILGTSQIVNQTISTNIPVGDSAVLIFNTPINFAVASTDSLFKIKTWIELTGDNISYNDSSYIEIISRHTPTLPIVNNPTIPYGGNAIIVATTSTNDVLLWYNDSLTGNKIGQGSLFTSNNIIKDTNFWVEASSGQNTNIQVGNAATVNTLTTYPAPYSNYFGGAKHQILIRADELLAGGIIPNQMIDSISFEVTEIGTIFSGVLNNFQLDITQTNDSVLNPNSFVGNLTTVVQPSNFNVQLGINKHKLEIPFIWDGTSNLIIQTSYSNGNSGTSNTYLLMKHTTTSYNSCSYYRADGVNSNLIYNSLTPTSVSNKRPNIKIYFSGGSCTTPRVKSTVTISNPPNCDLGVVNIIKPVSAIGLNTKEPITIEIRNYGVISQVNYLAHYQINNGNIITDTIIQPILPYTNYIYKFKDSLDLSLVGNSYAIKAWSSIICDTISFNDTATKTVHNLISNYCNAGFTTGTGYGDYINRVKLSTLENWSGATPFPSYTNYGNMGNVLLTTNNLYPLILQHATYNSNNYMAAWIDYNRDGDFDDINEKLGEIHMNSATINIDTILFLVPSNAMAGKTRLRVRTVYSLSGIDPCTNYTWGETEDYEITILEQINYDIGVVEILSPKMLSTQTNYKFKAILINNGTDSVSNFNIFYKLNSNLPVISTYSGVIYSGDTAHFEFNTVNPPSGRNDLCIYVMNSLDLNNYNDQKCLTFYKIPTYEPPYNDNFENANVWHPDTLQPAWEFGNPGGSVIQSAYSPSHVWMTDLNSNYQNNSTYYLYSPKFDLTKTQADSVIFWHNFHTEPLADYCVLQYLTSYGYWYDLGTKNDSNGTNWYNTQFGQAGWTGNSQGWIRSSFELSNAQFIAPITQFRFAFITNPQNNFYDGWAIDNFELTVAPTHFDAGIIEIKNLTDTAIAGDMLIVEVAFKNYGTDTISILPITVKLNNGQSITETWTGKLAPNDSANYIFKNHLNAIAGNFQILATLNLNGDIYKYNDTISKKIFGKSIASDLGIIRLEPDIMIQNPLTINCLVGNFGSTVITNFSIEFSVNGTVITTQNFIGTLQPGDSTAFVVNHTNLNVGTHQLCAELQYTLDMNVTNNIKCQNAFVSNLKNIEKPKWQLLQNTPNPTNGVTQIGFNLPKSGEVNLKITNIFGEIVYDFSGVYNRGKGFISLNINGLPSGIYFYTMKFDESYQTKKMIIQK
jgi:hypothetical protein